MSLPPLQSLPALQNFAATDLDLLATVAPTKQFAVGSYLCEQGKPGFCAFLLLQGEVEVLRTAAGRTYSVATLGPGEMVGQLALVDGSPRAASVVVRKDVTAMLLMRDTFEKLLQAASPLALRFQRQVAVAGIRQLRRTTERLGQVMVELERDQAATDAERQRAAQKRRNGAVVALAALSEPALDPRFDREPADVTDRTPIFTSEALKRTPAPPMTTPSKPGLPVMAPTAVAATTSRPARPK
jgi:CRP-like cAMP-binding protein